MRHCAGCQFFRAETRGQIWDTHGDHIKDVNVHLFSTVLHVTSNLKQLHFDYMNKINYTCAPPVSQFGFFGYVEGLRIIAHLITFKLPPSQIIYRYSHFSSNSINILSSKQLFKFYLNIFFHYYQYFPLYHLKSLLLLKKLFDNNYYFKHFVNIFLFKNYNL